MTSTNAKALAKKLAGWNYPDDTILAHVKRDFGYAMDKSELTKLKGSMPMPKRYEIRYNLREAEPAISWGADEANAKTGSTRLRKAIAAYWVKQWKRGLLKAKTVEQIQHIKNEIALWEARL